MFEKTLAEKILKGLRRELAAKVDWRRADVERYREQLNRVERALEELRQFGRGDRDR